MQNERKTVKQDNKSLSIKPSQGGTSLVAQWSRLCAPNAGGPGSVPGQGTKSHTRQQKLPHAKTKTWHSQIHFSKVSK